MLKKTFWEKRVQSQANITTEREIYFADVSLYPSGGSLRSAQNRLWLPSFSYQREEKCPHGIVLSRHGVQPQKALDETGKRAFEYPSFQHSGCLASKQLNLFHISRCVRGRASFVMHCITCFPTLFAQFFRFRHKKGSASEFFILRQTLAFVWCFLSSKICIAVGGCVRVKFDYSLRCAKFVHSVFKCSE